MRSTKSRSWTKALAGLAPVPAPPHVFALDAERLRYAAFERRNGDALLADYRSVPLPAESFHPGPLGGSIRESGVLREALEALLSSAQGRITEESLVLPDSWARLAFVETSELPRGSQARDDVLRWKLRRLVPYRVEDLRVRGLEVPALAGQEEPRRVLLLFAMEVLLAQIEELFAAHGIRVGYLSNESLALVEAAGEGAAHLDLAGLVHLGRSGYSLLFTRQGKPVVYRFKELDPASATELEGVHVQRDLRLTRKYLRDHVDGALLRRILIAGRAEALETWAGWLQEIFEVPVTPIAVARSHQVPEAPAEEVVPLAGAAARNR